MALSRSERAVANGLQSVWDAGGNTPFGVLFNMLDTDAGSNSSTYVRDLDQLSPGASAALAARQPAETQNFANAMLSCPEFTGPTALVTEGGCAWARLMGRVTNQQRTNGIPGFNISNITYQIGGQAQVAPNLFAGGSLACEIANLGVSDSTSKGDGQSGYAGLSLKWQPGLWYVAFAVSGSYGQFHTSRIVDLPGFSGVAAASPELDSVDARIRTAYNLAFARWYVRPYLDLDLIHTHSAAYNETGPTTVSLAVSGSSQTTFVATPAIELGGRVDLKRGVTLRPFVMGGVSLFSNSDWQVQAGFSGAPAGASPFTTTLSEGEVVGRFGAGVNCWASATSTCACNTMENMLATASAMPASLRRVGDSDALQEVSVLIARVVKVLMVASLAAFAFLVTFGNLTDYDANFQFLRHVMSMDTTFPGKALAYRAITEPVLWHLGYALIILGEGLTCIAFTVAAAELARHLRSDAVWSGAASGSCSPAPDSVSWYGSLVLW